MDLSNKQLEELLESMEDAWIQFSKEYLIDFNGTKAALRAGYAESGAHVSANRLLNNDKVRSYLSHLITDRSKRTRVTADRVVEEIAKIAFHNVKELLDYFDGNVLFHDLDNMEFPEIIKTIKVKEITNRKGERIGKIAEIIVHDKIKALELLGKHTAIFTENLNLMTNGKALPGAQHTTNIIINHRAKGDPLLD